MKKAWERTCTLQKSNMQLFPVTMSWSAGVESLLLLHMLLRRDQWISGDSEFHFVETIIMAAHSNGQAIIFLSCGFYLLSSSIYLFFLSSPNLSGRRLDVYHTSTHGVALQCEFRMQAWNVLRAARWKYRTQKIAIWAPSDNFVGLYLRN